MKPRVFWSVLSHDSSNVLLTRGYFWFTTRLRVPRLFDVGRSVGSTSSVRRRRSVGGGEGGRRTDTVRLSPSERPSERERAMPTSHERSNADGPETTRGVSTGASVSGASDDRSDGKDVRRRRTKRQRARVVRAQRASGDASRGATRRTDGETDAATRRFGALGNTVVRDCR